jgi:chromate transporter
MSLTKNEQLRRLRELAFLFLKLGTTAFGGPAAHIAMMEEEVVRRRKWLTESQFLDFLGATNLIPGPNSTEMAIHVGRERAGSLGLMVAGVCFIFPAMAIVMLIAWAYTTFGKLPEVQGILYGVKPVIIAVVAQAIWNLTRKTMLKPLLLSLGILAAACSLLGGPELLILLFAGIFMFFFQVLKNRKGGGLGISVAAALGAGVRKSVWAVGVIAAPLALVPFSQEKLFFFFLKVGSVLYGSGYVLLAFLQGTLVEKYGWLTQVQLLDATAVGQFTPGPVFTTATFIGYVLSGVTGAIVATVGIFLPSFIFVAISGRLIPAIRKSPRMSAFLDGVNAASLGLMIAVTIQLGREAIVDPLTILLAITSATLLIRWKVNSVWLVLAGATLGSAKILF